MRRVPICVTEISCKSGLLSLRQRKLIHHWMRRGKEVFKCSALCRWIQFSQLCPLSDDEGVQGAASGEVPASPTASGKQGPVAPLSGRPGRGHPLPSTKVISKASESVSPPGSPGLDTARISSKSENQGRQSGNCLYCLLNRLRLKLKNKQKLHMQRNFEKQKKAEQKWFHILFTRPHPTS